MYSSVLDTSQGDFADLPVLAQVVAGFVEATKQLSYRFINLHLTTNVKLSYDLGNHVYCFPEIAVVYIFISLFAVYYYD